MIEVNSGWSLWAAPIFRVCPWKIILFRIKWIFIRYEVVEFHPSIENVWVPCRHATHSHRHSYVGTNHWMNSFQCNTVELRACHCSILRLDEHNYAGGKLWAENFSFFSFILNCAIHASRKMLFAHKLLHTKSSHNWSNAAYIFQCMSFIIFCN